MKRFLSNFSLKLIALVAMTFDHVGKILFLFYPNNETILLIESIFSIIGRLAFPIFAFLIIEGFYHTSNIKKYLIRLGVIAFIIFSGILILGFIPNIQGQTILYKYGNIFIDLILILLFTYLINSKKIIYKILSLLTLIYPIICLLFQTNIITFDNKIFLTLISGLMTQYSLITPLILILYSLFSALFNLYLHSKGAFEVYNLETCFRNDSFVSRRIIFIYVISAISLIMYAFTYYPTINLNTDFIDNTYFILSALPILFYNDKLGYNNKIFKSAYYLYYPISICIIYLIVYLTSI